jgi:hypothetical protein
MNKTVAVLIAIIVALAGAFAWYAAKHHQRERDEDAYFAEGHGSHVGPRILKADLDAKGLDALALEVGVGEVHVGASDDGKVHVQLTLQQKDREFLGMFHWHHESVERSIAEASLAQKTEGGKLTLSLDGDDHNALKQDWEVQLPARLALDTDMKVGELVIEGMAGGVDARLDVGELRVDVIKGDLRGEVNVGEIRATNGSARHGRIEVTTSIGDALVSIGGNDAGSRARGGLGNHVTVEGDGPDEMRLSVNIGDASLHVTGGEDKHK